MNNKLTIFNFQEQEVRTVLMDNEPWFVGADVCNILDIKNTGDAFSRLKEYEKKELNPTEVIGITDNPSITRLIIISESGLYRLVMTSRKPQAESFQDWVCQEVIPSIRKTGSYSLESQEPPKSTLLDKALIVGEYLKKVISNKSIGEQLAIKCINRAVPELEGVLEEAKIELSLQYADTQQDKLTPTDIANVLVKKGYSQYNTAVKVNKLLESLGLQKKTMKSKKWLPTTFAKTSNYSIEVDVTPSLSQKGNNWAGKQLRWSLSTVDYILESFDA